MVKPILISDADGNTVYQSLETDYNTILETITKDDHEENSVDIVNDTKPERCGRCKKCDCSN